jgi:hypothetical protein
MQQLLDSEKTMTGIKDYLTTPYHYRSMSMRGLPWQPGCGTPAGCDGCLRME